VCIQCVDVRGHVRGKKDLHMSASTEARQTTHRNVKDTQVNARLYSGVRVCAWKEMRAWMHEVMLIDACTDTYGCDCTWTITAAPGVHELESPYFWRGDGGCHQCHVWHLRVCLSKTNLLLAFVHTVTAYTGNICLRSSQEVRKKNIRNQAHMCMLYLPVEISSSYICIHVYKHTHTLALSLPPTLHQETYSWFFALLCTPNNNILGICDNSKWRHRHHVSNNRHLVSTRCTVTPKLTIMHAHSHTPTYANNNYTHTHMHHHLYPNTTGAAQDSYKCISLQTCSTPLIQKRSAFVV